MPRSLRPLFARVRPVHGLLILLSSVLVLRLGGYGLAWLPRPGRLAALLLVTHAADVVWRHPARRGWAGRLRPHAFALGLAGIGVLAFVIRLAGFGADLGHQPFDIDEHRLASNVKHYFVTGELRHTTVEHYPGLVFWLFSGASFVGFVAGLTRGLPHSPGDISLEMYVAAARMANVLVAAGIAVLTGLIARRITTAGAALLAAFVVAIVPLSVDLVLVRNDPGMVVAVLAATHAALTFMHDRRMRWALWAGALAGIAGGIKYSSVFAIVPVLIATWSEGPLRERLQRAALALIGAAAAVAITNHFIWYDFPNFLQQLSDQVGITGAGHWAASSNPASFYVMILDRFGTGWIMLLLGAAFAAYGLASRDRRLWIFLSFPILYIWFMTGRPSQFPRWVFPLLPYVAVAGCAALAHIVRTVGRVTATSSRRVAYARRALAAAIAAAVLWQPLWSGVVSYSRHLTTPTHIAAETWIEHNVAEGQVVLLGNDWLSLTPRHVVRRVPNIGAVLDGGIEQLSEYDWIVVPEPYFGNKTLRRLGFAQRFHASQGFGGSVGYDFEIYAVPRLPASVR